MMNIRFPSTTTAVRPRWVLGLTSIAYFMVVLDSLVVVTALPRMQRDLQAGLAALQWTVNSYGIAFAAGIITAAALGDRFGRRRVFILGLALFTLSSAACALAPDTAALIVARTVQGLGAAVVLPLSLTILTAAFPPRRRGLVVGIYGGLAGLAVAAGPLVGGAVTESLDWHWIFWLNVPTGLLAAALGTRLLPESHGAPQRLDLSGVALVTGGVFALVWSLARASDVGWSSPQTVGTLLAGCALLLAFVWRQRRAHAPLVPMGLPTVPTAVLNAVPATQLGTASGINYMAQRFGAVFAIAIGSAVFSAHGHLGSPASVTAGFRPALWSAVAFAVLAAVTALAIPGPAHRTTGPRATARTDPADALVVA